MSDLETRLRDALVAGANGAPTSERLVAGARTRAHTRRRRRLGLAVGAVLAAVVVPAGLRMAAGPADDGAPTNSTSGWRSETWRNLEVLVPPDWAHGSRATWCIGHADPGPPVVTRPEGGVRSIACTPAEGYGVSFFDPKRLEPSGKPGALEQYIPQSGQFLYPRGAWVGYARVTTDAVVSVVARDEETARLIIESARPVDFDSYGCSFTLGRMIDAGSSAHADRMSVCRYGTDGWLIQSELLSDEDSAQAWQALQSAPGPTAVVSCARVNRPQDTDTVVMALGTTQFLIVWGGLCDPGPTGEPGNRGVFVGGERLDLTADVMYWALSPGWSGVVDGDVPLPEKLRQ